ncbi:HEAT repeat protein [Oleiphilus messinensis]|uniref:HEAT repeat protein n=1 Tax=Oleiphilus messinensis TaxID=141451 RepID=A0A1Y0IFC6_9GAMM|nr:hypothetical protein [Oleiphilus messinensis]ARU58829.1 HEAT repeat protein [Oleiphilus messinensis]
MAVQLIPPQQKVIPLVLETHAEEAAMLYLQWHEQRAAIEPDVRFMGRLKARIDAHLDGLLGARSKGWEVAQALLENHEPGEVFVVALLALMQNRELLRDLIEGALQDSALFTAIVDAFCWIPEREAGAWFQRFCQSSRPELVTFAVCRLISLREVQVPLDPVTVTQLKQRGLQGCYEAHVEALKTLLEYVVAYRDLSLVPELRKLALETREEPDYVVHRARLLIGDTTVLPLFKHWVMTSGAVREEAVLLSFQGLESQEAKSWIAELQQTESHERYTLIAIGAMRERSLLPWVLKKMQEPALARIAGQSVARIAGIDLTEYGLTLDDESIDEKWLELEGDELLPWPNQQKIEQRLAVKAAS